jgi:hypothetical protein
MRGTCRCLQGRSRHTWRSRQPSGLTGQPGLAEVLSTAARRRRRDTLRITPAVAATCMKGKVEDASNAPRMLPLMLAWSGTSRIAPSRRRGDVRRQDGTRASPGALVRSPPGGPSGTGSLQALRAESSEQLLQTGATVLDERAQRQNLRRRLATVPCCSSTSFVDYRCHSSRVLIRAARTQPAACATSSTNWRSISTTSIATS